MRFQKRSLKHDQPKGPENLKDIIGQLFVARGWGRVSERARLEQAWAEAAGEIVAGQTRVLSFKRGILEVEVRGSVLLQELASFHKRKLLAALQSLLSNQAIRDLKFRAACR